MAADATKPRIALVLQGDPSLAGSWSGVPASLGNGLTGIGCEVVPINAEVPRGGAISGRLKMSWSQRASNRWFSAASSLIARRRLARAGQLDGAVMMGSGFTMPASPPFVTFDDMTVAQARAQDSPDYRSLSESAVRRWRGRQEETYGRCRACCAASNWAADSVRDDYAVPEEKIHVTGFGHNIEMEKPERDWSVPRFLWVGVDWPRKNGEVVCEAFRRLREARPDATLDLVGNHPQVDQEGVTGHGRLALGSKEGQEKYRGILRRSTCFVMPSVFEPLGIAYIDAGTAGMPSIGTTVGGAIDAIADAGRLVPPGDVEALLGAMTELSDPETAKRLGDRARERSDLYTWRAVAERVLRALEPAGIDLDGLTPFIERRT